MSKAKATSQQLYSATLPDNIRQTVLRIPAPDDVKYFHGMAFKEVEAGDVSSQSWLQAYLNDDKSWQVQKFTHYRGGELNDNVDQSTVLDGVCFVDALRFINETEEREKAQGNESSQPPRCKGDHWTKAADEAGQPVDDGMLYPAAGGRVLVDGALSIKALDVADKTETMALVPVSTETQNFNILATGSNNALALTGVDDLEALHAQKAGVHEAVAQLSQSRSDVVDVLKALNGCVDAEFVKDFDGDCPPYIIAGLFAGCFWRGYSITRGGTYSGPNIFYATVAGFERSINKMPDDLKKERSVLLDFTKATRGVYFLENAISVYNNAKGTAKAPKALQKSLKMIDKAVKVMPAEAIKENKIMALKAAFYDAKPPEASSFCKPLKDHGEAIQEQLMARKELLQNSM